MKAAFFTLGCKVNQTESEALAGAFRSGGYEIVPFEEMADVYVINTCTVTNSGDRKSRQVIRRACKANPEAVVVVMGCYAQMAPEEVCSIPGVDLVVGTQDRGKILALIEEARQAREPLNLVRGFRGQNPGFEELPLLETESRVRATLKIQEGCNQFCTYCIIPYARGPVRSRAPEKALEEAAKLVECGYKEIVLTGIHVGAYGSDLGIDLNSLVERMVKIPGLRRLRLGSIESGEISNSLLETFAQNSVLCPHLHIPLQSGNDRILSAMKRPYNSSEFRSVVEKVRSALPGVAITTDIIVGFPGETEYEHSDALEFSTAMRFAGIHVFKYSPRAGTAAANFPQQVAVAVKDQRSKDFLELDNSSRADYAQSFLGTRLEVLAEQLIGRNTWEGHTANYLKVQFHSTENLRGCMLEVELLKNCGDYILGG